MAKVSVSIQVAAAEALEMPWVVLLGVRYDVEQVIKTIEKPGAVNPIVARQFTCYPPDIETEVGKLRKAFESRQVVMTTHCPYIVDVMQPHEVYLVHQGRALRLDRAPGIDVVMDVPGGMFSLGEVWSNEHPKWAKLIEEELRKEAGGDPSDS